MAKKTLKILILDIRHFSFTATIIVVLSLSFLLSFRGIQSSKLDLLLKHLPCMKNLFLGHLGPFCLSTGIQDLSSKIRLCHSLKFIVYAKKKFNEKLRTIQDKISI